MSKRPGIQEQISSRLSIRSVGGKPDLATPDYAAAIGALDNTLHQILLSVLCGDWQTERDQLKEIVLRRSWSMWRERKRLGNLNVQLNTCLANIAIEHWECSQAERKKLTATAAAKALNVDIRRYNTGLKEHHKDLVGWLDIETAQALESVGYKLNK